MSLANVKWIKIARDWAKNHIWAVLLALFVVGLFFPVIVKNKYITRIMCLILMYSTIGGALNVINGYSGQFCIGFAGFVCVGAYTQAILSTRLGWSFWPLLLLGGILACIVGFVVSLPTLRLSGIYLAIVTIGMSEVIRLIALNWTSLTGGSHGIRGIPMPKLLGLDFSNPRIYYYVFFFLAVLFLFCTTRLLNSRVGRAWLSIRENQIAAASLGVPVARYKCICFMYAAFWAGLMGSAYASYVVYIDSTFFTMGMSIDLLSMVIIGGSGTLVGPVVGACVVEALTEGLRSFGTWRYVVYALLIIAMMWVRPQGLFGSSKSSDLAYSRKKAVKKRS